MEKTIKINEVRAKSIENGEKAVSLVKWTIEFTDSGFSSKSVGQTILDDINNASFIPYQQVTKQNIIDWFVRKEGGDQFLSMLQQVNAGIITSMKAAANSSVVDYNFVEPDERQIQVSVA